MVLKFFDRYETTLSAGYTSGGGSLSVAAIPSGAGASDEWYLKVEAEGANTEEVFKVTAYTGSGPYTLTVTGAQANTGASDHASGAVVKGSVLTAASLAQLASPGPASMTVSAFDTATSSGSVQGGLSLVYLTDSPYTALWNGSAWEYWYQGFKCSVPVNGDFAWVNQGTSTVTAAGKSVLLEGEIYSGANLRLRKKSLASLPVTYTVGFEMAAPHLNNYTLLGLLLRESASSKIVTFAVNGNGGLMGTSFSSESGSPVDLWYLNLSGSMTPGRVFLRWTIDSTNRTAYISVDGRNFVQVQQELKNSSFTTAPDEIGFFVNPNNPYMRIQMHLFHWAE